jgi:hypothetical protein
MGGPYLRECFSRILTGDWRSHDPYALEDRLNGQTDLYNRPNQVTILVITSTIHTKLSQSSVFRTFQGWLLYNF